jgi:hypothetical protein
LLYLFSSDVEFGLDYEQLGVTERGARYNLFCVPDSTRVYSVLREREVGVHGYSSITGRIISGEDNAILQEDNLALADVRITIQTDDGHLIDGRYRGVMPTALGVFRAIAAGVDAIGTPMQPAEFSIVVTPTYEADPNGPYAWLNSLVCVGFGRVQEVAGVFRRVTYDIYAMQ